MLFASFWGYLDLAKKWREESIEEMRHADRFGTEFYQHPSKREAGKSYTFSAGVLGNFDRDITKLMEGINPVFNGAMSDLLSCLPFLGLMALLFRAGTRKKPG